MTRRSVSHLQACFFAVTLLISVKTHAELEEFSSARTLNFEAGYDVVETDGQSDRTIKSIPGPTEATVKGLYRAPNGLVYYLSDWSWERRLRGEQHYWILPKQAVAPPPPTIDKPEVYPAPVDLTFPDGFSIVDGTNLGASLI
ncbi:MAG: hypothetical protein AAF236_15230, partial [Verrucomicrobiota bacterium]